MPSRRNLGSCTSSIFAPTQDKTGRTHCFLVQSRWHKLERTLRGSDIEFFNGYRARDDSGIREENAALRSKQSLPVADRCEAVFEMKDRIDTNDDIERPVGIGEARTAIRNFEPGLMRKALCHRLAAGALDGCNFDIHPR
jgi:hypothetical protein